MLTLSVALGIVALGVFAYLALKFVGEWQLRNKMMRKACRLERQGVKPAGSSLSHGMCLNKQNAVIVPDQMESLVWYKRLMD
ncbi:hypothetical protein [Marinobacter sp. HN1S83]|uniref:hypothetical protein n=1 Tax=Marinobacter sp. HN1S83 TaxID=3382301 RepID=UPI00387B1C06